MSGWIVYFLELQIAERLVSWDLGIHNFYLNGADRSLRHQYHQFVAADAWTGQPKTTQLIPVV